MVCDKNTCFYKNALKNRGMLKNMNYFVIIPLLYLVSCLKSNSFEPEIKLKKQIWHNSDLKH